MQVRPAGAGDLDALAVLEAACFPDPGSPAWSRDLLAGELGQATALILVAIDDAVEAAIDRVPLGYAAFRRVGPESELLRVAVAPDARGRRIGQRLIEAGFERLRSEGATTCFLEARPSNRSARALYDRLGFQAIDRRKKYFPDGSDALVLRLEIAP